MQRLRTAIATAACLLMTTAWLGCGLQTCGCGASPDDAFAQHDLSYPGEHELADECACRCADGPVRRRPLDEEGTCEYEDVTCTDDEGYPADLVCSG